MRILRDFWNNFEGFVDFFNKNGEEIDNIDGLLETKILKE